MTFKKIKGEYYFIFFVIVMFFIYKYHESTFLGPYSKHQWRQADCLSITYNYYKYNLNFLEPQINWVDDSGNSKVISEFPIIYYLVAQLWKIFGQHESIFRFINLSIALTGLFFLYKTIKLQLKDNFWAIFLTILFFTSPIYVYYSNSFISDVNALSIAFIGLHFLWRYYNSYKFTFLVVGTSLFMLAGMLKITALLSFLGVFAIHLFLIYQNKNKQIKWTSVIPFLVTLSGIVLWYSYTGSYNKKNLSGIFLQGILPIWEMEASKISTNFTALFNLLLPQYFNPSLLFFLFLGLIFCLFNYSKVNKALLSLSLICLAGTTMYFILFFQVFDVHDYYLTNLLVNIPLILVTIVEFSLREFPSFLNTRAVKITALTGLLFLIYNTAVIQRMNYDPNDRMVSQTFIVSRETRAYWEWYHWQYSNTLKALETIDPYLRTLNIKNEDMVVSIPDESINISLYLMRQRGFSGFGYSHIQGNERIEQLKNIGAKYLIINDPQLAEAEYLKPYLTQKIGSYKNVQIYKLTN